VSPSSSVRLKNGSILQERYKVLRFIGRGGMGSVYECEDLRLPGKRWALKEMIVEEPAVAEQVRESFGREARFLASLRHPSMPMIVDVFSVDSCQYLVMEFIEGLTLADKIEKEGPPSSTVALSWALELAQVLDYLHRQERPVIFRDLKPENVMLSSDGHIKMIDYGLARHFVPGKRRDTQSSGTVGYTPPEQWEDHEQSDPRSDIFSLGATLYFILAGKPPSPVYGKNNLRQHRSNIEPEIERLVSRCLAVAPSERYESAAVLIGHLLSILSTQGHQNALHDHMATVGPQPRAAPPPKRSPQKARPLRSPLRAEGRLLKILGLGLVLFVVGVVLPFLGDRSTPTADLTLGPLVDQLRANEPVKKEVRGKLEKGQYKEAIAQLDALVTQYPKDAEAHILKNNAYASISGQPLYRIPVVSSWGGKEREGFEALFGWALAQGQINQDRPADKPSIYLELYNDESDPERLLEIVTGLSADKEVPLMIGPWTSQQALMIAPLVNDGGLPTITPVSSDPRVLPSGPNVFCVADTDINKSRTLAEYLYQDGRRKVAVFSDRGRYVSRTAAGLFSERFEELGGEVVLQDDYRDETTDFSSRVRKARGRDADCVFLAEYRMEPVVSFCRTAKKLGWDVPVASQVAGFGGELLRRGGEAVEGLYMATTYVPEYASPQQRAFQEDFRRVFDKRQATHREAQVYDSLQLAVAALDAVGPDREKLRRYLTSIGRETPTYHGVSGDFAPSRHLNARPVYAVRVLGGNYEILTPDKIGP
jgi:ABC-type branched-subunit amino acid transport system substrate-binding protein/predicted Ser/Thr protein kinase